MGMTDADLEAHDRLMGLVGNLSDLPQRDVVLLGDVMLDCYIHGFADNLNSRAPVPVLKETFREQDVGAAAHVARGLWSLGLRPYLYGVIGDDDAGASILDALNEEHVDTDGLVVLEGRTTTVKTRLLASRQSLVTDEQLMLRWDIEDDRPIPTEALDLMIDQAIARLPGAAAVILSDYGLGVITDEGATRVIEAAKQHGVPVIADPKLTGFHRTRDVDWVVMQSHGLELMRRRLGVDGGRDAAQQLLVDHDWKHLLVLAGSDGVTIYEHNGNDAHVDCTLSTLRQMIGLIDAAAVAIAVALAANLDVEGTALLANACSECILGADGYSRFALTREDVMERLRESAWNLQISKR
jgi:D-beta-D-heptose 7-phosphate kinase/D-beta-D-heptose 1-phosphate adenosyltransferase